MTKEITVNDVIDNLGIVTLAEKTLSETTVKLQMICKYGPLKDVIVGASYYIIFERDGKTWYVSGHTILSKAIEAFNFVHLKEDKQ